MIKDMAFECSEKKLPLIPTESLEATSSRDTPSWCRCFVSFMLLQKVNVELYPPSIMALRKKLCFGYGLSAWSPVMLRC